MTEKETLTIISKIGKKIDESELRIKKLEDIIKFDPKNGTILKGPINYSGNIYPTTLSDIGSVSSFVNNLYLSGKIIYPDNLDFGVNNDFRIDKMGKIGFHAGERLDSVTIKGCSSFAIQNARYIGDNILFFQIAGSIEEFINQLDILLIEGIYYHVINVSKDKVEIESLNGEKTHMAPEFTYDMIVYNNILGIKNSKNDDVLKINAQGDIFFKSIERKADININGTVDIKKGVFDKLEVNNLTISNTFAPVIPNLNAEMLGGKKGPENGEIVSTKDKQELWNKSFGDELIMNYNRIVNVSDPLYDMDAVNKRYVDKYITSGIKVAPSVKCASVQDINADYDKREMKLYLRETRILDDLVDIFDGYKMKLNDSCIIMHQQEEYQNGIYRLVSDGLASGRIILQRIPEFGKGRKADELRGYYVFIENGIKFGNIGVCFEYDENLIWDETPIRFNMFSKAESYSSGDGIKKSKNNFALNVGDQFEFNSGKLQLKKISIGNDNLRSSNITIIPEGGLDMDKSVVNLGESIRMGLKVNKKHFHFGKNNELEISSMKEDNSISDDLSVSRSVSTATFNNVYQLFPPSRLNIEVQYSEDYFEKEKDMTVQYFISTLDQDGKETNYKASEEIFFSDDVKSIFININWDSVPKADGYLIYRRINSAYYSTKISSFDHSILDILVPRNFTKIDWKQCSEPENINKTVLTVNHFATLGPNFITGGGVGIGTRKPKSALHIISNEVNSDGTPLILETGNKEAIHLIKKGVSDGLGVQIIGECVDGKSVLEIGKNIRFFADKEGVIYLGRTDEVMDMNERLGSDTFTVQTTDGGIYSAGDIMIGENNSFGTFNNKLGNNAAILKTGCMSNSIANQLSFTWEGDELKAVPMYDGSMLTRKKISVKNFTIEHPLDDSRYLVHACLEGATADVFYRGQDAIDIGENYVDINLPNYYYKLVVPGTSTLILTPRGEPFFQLGGEVLENENYIRVYLDKTYNRRARFYWEVKGERVNTEFNTQPLKNGVNVRGIGPYTYFL